MGDETRKKSIYIPSNQKFVSFTEKIPIDKYSERKEFFPQSIYELRESFGKATISLVKQAIKNKNPELIMFLAKTQKHIRLIRKACK